MLVRIAESYDIPRELMGLSWWGPGGTYCGEVPVAQPSPTGEDEDVRRRTLIATTTVAAFGQVMQGRLGGLTELALPADQPLPLRLGMAHVHAVRAVTEQLRGVARQFGGQADLFGTAARLYTRWLKVPASEVVTVHLQAALAELYTEAGWVYHDSGMDGTGCFTRALRLAHEAGDDFGVANAARQAGQTLVRSGHPNDALKCFQLGQFVLTRYQADTARPALVRADDSRIRTLTAWLNQHSAAAYALLDRPEEAQRCLAEAREGWTPRDTYDRAGMDSTTAVIQLDFGRFDLAESFAASAVRTFGEGHRRGRMRAELALAEVHVRAGEPRGLTLARQAIEAVSTLQSVAVRRERLVPLATALEARPGHDAKEIARLARQVAATRM